MYKNTILFSIRFSMKETLFTPAIILLILTGMLLSTLLFGNDRGVIRGKVLTGEGKPLAGASVYVKGTRLGDMTDSEGRFVITNVPAGQYTVVAEFIGRQTQENTVEVPPTGEAMATFTLPIVPVTLPGIVVTTTRGGDITEAMSHLSPTVIRQSAARVTGELLRQVPGVDAVRRGPTGLDPVIRGLRETEVGTYVDGTRYFPAGPARMDSPLSHYDPTAIHKIQIVKGPYALTWGAGNLSAIHAESRELRWQDGSRLHGRFISGYHSNVDAPEVAGALGGNSGLLAYWLHANWRESHDYTAGGGEVIPGDFHSREVRGKVGFRLSSHSRLIISGGYQYQNDIDYPGRLLNADFFKVKNFNIRYRLKKPAGKLRNLEVLAYVNNVDHRMDNDGKPTAEPDSNRMPPFPLLVDITTNVNVKGARLAATLSAGNHLDVELGGDVYQANRDALRNISRRDNGMAMLTNDIVWPDATIRDVGVFVKVQRSFINQFRVSGTIRTDFVSANADTVSEFFRENVPGSLESSETNLSGALMLEAPLNQHWLISVGIGSAVRTADASERYSDRFPSSKAQTSAEFMGNPALKPERSTQADLWIEAAYERFSLHLNGFVRRMDNYITLTATDLPRKLPLSPPTVFRYINGEAEFLGGEAAAVFYLSRGLRLSGAIGYLWGKDKTLDEPILGIAPLNTTVSIAYRHPKDRYFLETSLTIVSEQNRVAIIRGETPTPGYAIADLRGGVRILSNAQIFAGIRNLTDKKYVNHLNAKNPFTGYQIPEPGRTVFVNLSFSF